MARAVLSESRAEHPALAIRHHVTNSADYAAYAAHYRQAFIELIGKCGRESTTYEEQYEAARLDAEAIVADPRFRMTYQHRDRQKNITMVQAMLYWRDYTDILPPEEIARRAEAYLRSLPALGRLRMRRTIGQRSRVRYVPSAAAQPE